MCGRRPPINFCQVSKTCLLCCVPHPLIRQANTLKLNVIQRTFYLKSFPCDSTTPLLSGSLACFYTGHSAHPLSLSHTSTFFLLLISNVVDWNEPPDHKPLFIKRTFSMAIHGTLNFLKKKCAAANLYDTQQQCNFPQVNRLQRLNYLWQSIFVISIDSRAISTANSFFFFAASSFRFSDYFHPIRKSESDNSVAFKFVHIVALSPRCFTSARSLPDTRHPIVMQFGADYTNSWHDNCWQYAYCWAAILERFW